MKLKPEFVATVKAALAQNPKSMAEAARVAKMHLNTFSKYAKELGLYEPNQSGKGASKSGRVEGFPLSDILKGLHPQYGTNHLKKRLISEGVFENRCYKCPTTSDWYGQVLVMHLDHINGDSCDHRLPNLILLCPNCHSQTATYGGGNARKHGRRPVSQDEYLIALRTSTSINQAIAKLGLTVSKYYYNKFAELLEAHPEINIPHKPAVKQSTAKVKAESRAKTEKLWLAEQQDRFNEIVKSGFDFSGRDWKTRLGRELDMSTSMLARWLTKVQPNIPVEPLY